MIYIQIAEQLELSDDRAAVSDLLEEAARTTLKLAAEDAEAELTIALTDDEHIQQLNQQFLGLDTPTDVLSFPAGDLDPDSEELYLGDVVISVPRALAQASAAGHPYLEEMQLLVVHGVLHLLGHDHGEPDEKQRMWDLQRKALSHLGCSISPP
jgi:probable rRNA maturation factor